MRSADEGPVSAFAAYTTKAPSTLITPPGAACRILPSFSPPGCHVYDSYRNCFRHRPEVRAKLLDAARRHEAHRLAALHANDLLHTQISLSFTSTDCLTHSPSQAEASARGVNPVSSVDDAFARLPTPCRCSLNATQLFATVEDVPQPPLPLSKCEMHEVLLSLPPRWQNYPWQLCFDTARDGFSLSTLYRRMEEVEEQQKRAKTIAFGLFFVHAREDAHFHATPTTATVAAYPPPTPPSTRSINADSTTGVASSNATKKTAATPTQASSTPTGDNSPGFYTSPATTGNSKSFQAAHRSSSMRYGAARGTLPYSVVGCFTPEVPSLAHHAANIYFGSAESTVFRLDQLGTSAQRGEWMRRAFDVKAARQAAAEKREKLRHAQHVSNELQSGAVKGSSASLASMHAPSRQGVGVATVSDRGTGSPHSSPRAQGAVSSGKRATKSLQGFAQLSDAAGQSRVPVPMPTHMTIEHLSEVAEAMAKSSDTPGGGTAPTSLLHTAASNSSAANTPATTPTTRGVVPAMSPASLKIHGFPPPASLVRRSLRASPVHGIVPRAPLLSKYGWAGRLDNRKFLVCNPHFFALGAGKSGAALYIDEALQFGTSSNWCETYAAPCLVGPRPALQTPSCTPAQSPARAQPPQPPGTPSVETSGTFPGLTSTLPHREFAISRVVWFVVTEDKRTFRLMNGAGNEVIACGGEEEEEEEEDTRCRCGRAGRSGDPDGVGSSELGSPVGLTYMHKCDLLPFTEQPY